MVAQGFGSLGLMTSVLTTPDGRVLERRPPTAPSPATSASISAAKHLDQLDRVHLRLDRGPDAPRQAGRQRGADALRHHAGAGDGRTVESGFMTKDLALLVGDQQGWLTTEASSTRWPRTPRPPWARRRRETRGASVTLGALALTLAGCVEADPPEVPTSGPAFSFEGFFEGATPVLRDPEDDRRRRASAGRGRRGGEEPRRLLHSEADHPLG
jgi:hypothetical protein